MNDYPYTTAEEDPFNVQPIVQQVKSIKDPRSSLLNKWILEQQQNPTQYPNPLQLPKPRFSTSDASTSFSNPYLAYPDLPRVTPFDTTAKDDTGSINSYDFVDDDDIPSNVAPEGAVPQDPPIPLPSRTTKSFRHSLTPSFRNLNLPFRSPISGNTDASSSRAFSRLSIFQRTPRSSMDMCSNNDNDNDKSSSILTHNRSISQQPTILSLHSPRASSRWRPSVLGHFYQPSASQSSILVSETHSPSRPSISSADTYNTSSTSRTATTSESNVLSTPPKIPDSIGSRNTLFTAALNLPTASGSSVWLHGSDNTFHRTHYQMLSRQRTPFTPELDDNILDDDDDDIDPPPTFCARHHDTIRPSIPYSSTGTLPRVKFSSLNTRSQRKKKKLVISGIGISEVRKLEGIKRWCESFGEVRKITRMSNGDLHVDFRDPEVADTVCRVRAKVHITGVGSVQLSWFAGRKR